MNKLIFKSSFVGLLAVLVSACGGGSGAGVTTNSQAPGGGGSSSIYTGPSARSIDVGNFRVYVWEELRAANRCGNCHDAGGTGTPYFVRTDDVNTAYNAALPLVDLSVPASSTLVSKVASGHNCWLPEDSACASIVEQYITNWANASGVGTTQSIVLSAPPIHDPGATKSFPADPTDFQTIVYTPYLANHCAGCHSEAGSPSQQPYFASSDIDVAYTAAKSKMDLNNPENSRFVRKLAQENHNCWSGNCAQDAEDLRQAIEDFANTITATTVESCLPSGGADCLMISKALSMPEGIVATAGGRFETDLVAKYEFKTGDGFVAYDTSGVGAGADINLYGDFEWVGGWGVRFSGGYGQANTDTSSKIYDMVQLTGAYSVEAWVAPANVTQEGPATIVGYANGASNRNFMLGQTLYNYDFLQRMSTTSANGEPAFSTPNADEVLQATLQHVVVTFDPDNGRCIFVNGQPAMDNHCDGDSGSIADWDSEFPLVLANEAGGPNNDHMWEGVIKMLAIHNRALTEEQVQQNFDVGVGQKYYLLFGVSHLTSIPEAFVAFEVAQFDSYSYLFNAPFFISLDDTVDPSGIQIEGMRIGINGELPETGQAYANMNETIGVTGAYGDAGQPLSELGTIIELKLGPDQDEFFLSFENFDGNVKPFVETSPSPTPVAAYSAVSPSAVLSEPDIGLKNFAEVNATMSKMTGVPITNGSVQALYNTVVQQLPTIEQANTFLPAHQMAVAQLAIEYCNVLVEDPVARAAYFPGFNFGVAAGSAFGDTSLIISPLLENMLGVDSGVELSTQPDDAVVTAELNSLISNLAGCPTCNTTDRTLTVVKSTCSAVLGSAVMLMQ